MKGALPTNRAVKMGRLTSRPISPYFWTGPKKLAQKHTRAFLAQTHLAHTKLGRGRAIISI